MNLKNTDLLRSTNLIGGKWVGADNGATLTVLNPGTGAVLGQVPCCSATETRRAIEAADAAWPAWRALTARRRAQLLQAWFKLILDNTDDLAQLVTAEGGKPLAEAKGEVIYGASFVEWFAEEAKRTYGESIPSPMADKRLLVIKQPIGVCAAITPWNFPLAMITRKVAPALAAGCPVIVKPAEATPLTALALAVLAEQAGFPPGVFNVVTGNPAEVGGELTANPIVRKLSFTGSTGVGRLLMAQCAPTVKKVSLELGGNAPFIVFDDANVDAAVNGALTAKYRNNGQTCVCVNRFLIQSGIYEEFAHKFAAKVAEMKIGVGTEAGVTLGPLINAAGLNKVASHVGDAIDKGARLLCGGKPHALGGNFFEPTVLADVTTEMKVAREETFGPLAALFRFDTEAQAVAMANDTEFGLAAYFYTADMGRCWRLGEALEYGMVGINTGMISNEVAPFGGIKQSGIGREGSKYGIEDYLEVKYLCFDIN
ncbi:succinate-semialdehyde dehydrogenase [Dechloromonas sp. TW-R-39-2]|uniref:NAD-dependent succinate-semialdehyde dehydrogenase n=1 Tax=Dechloromonas sp. TW-R-39-2 TaxID=2654218 RepID=UPI00193D7449|nr:NAD-dependent succinate-semialdehyde dehydrogenase [Dechloromonas sp. TW-R-39-2]QRM20878.1 succinate-semialdehyde dehydrogenase [Dechloromonas sp. TW-R-39-2]